MTRLFNAFLFKLRRDLTFKITLIIGAAMAVFMTLLYLGLDLLINEPEMPKMLSGQAMLVSSISPSQNFGLAIPINLISFIVLEFTQGTIRNKIIGGHSKGKIYISLFLNGLVFTLALVITYVLICFGLGCIFGGFDPQGATLASFGLVKMDEYYLIRTLIIGLLVYVSLVSFTVFIATLIRSIGPCIPIVIVLIVVLALIPSIAQAIAPINDTFLKITRVIDPLFALNAYEINEGTNTMSISNEAFYWGIANNLFYTVIFFLAGFFIFRKRDIK